MEGGIEDKQNLSRSNLKYVVGGNNNNNDTSGGVASSSVDDGFYCNSNDSTMNSENSNSSSTYKPEASSRSYVDETIHFSSLERSNLHFNGGDSSSTIDSSKYLPLDENYKSYKSILGSSSNSSGHENAAGRDSNENNQKDKIAENLISKTKLITVRKK